MQKVIQVMVKSVYGVDRFYVVSEHRDAIQAMTGRQTLELRDRTSLRDLGFTFEIVLQPKEVYS